MSFRNLEKAVKLQSMEVNFILGGEKSSSSVQTCGTMKMYCSVNANAATEADNVLLNYSAIIYLHLIRLCCY